MLIETREVLAGAYPNTRRSEGRSMLSHACVVAKPGDEVLIVLCGRVMPGSMADVYASDASAMPTCKTCRAKLKATNRQPGGTF